MREILLGLSVVAATAASASAGCAVSGERGYNRVEGEVCKSYYSFRGYQNGDRLEFRSGGHRWLWESTGGGDNWSLVRISPYSRHGMKGFMDGHTDYEGWIESGRCGRGWIRIRVLSCD